MSMFSKLFGRVSMESAPQQSLQRSSDEEDDDRIGPASAALSRKGDNVISSLDIEVEVGGGKGWPIDVSCMIYHPEQGLICVGTEGGAVYTFGDGFQFMRPWLTDDPNTCVAIVPLFPDKILVAFADNSVVVLELPNLNVLDLLQPHWLHKKCGDISCLHADSPGEKNFVYVGTTEGFMFVLDATDETEVKVVDYVVSCKSIGLPRNMILSDIQVYPKDEKLIALGFDGDERGAVVLFDHQKQKPQRVHETHAITAMAWHHSGDTLYAGTREGEILSITMEKTHFSCIWNAVVHKEDNVRLNASDDAGDFDAYGGSGVVVRRVHWLAPQPPSMQGCLFVLLTTRGVDNESLRNVVIGLSASGKTGIMEEVFALPPIPEEKIIGMKLVPTYDRTDEHAHRLLQNSNNSNESDEREPLLTPGIILLTQKQLRDSSTLLGTKYVRSLKIIRCPLGDVRMWSLEIGALPDPRVATEVQPAASEITCITGFTQHRSALSLAAVLIRKAADSAGVIGVVPTPAAAVAPATTHAAAAADNHPPPTERGKGRRLSAREFNMINQLNIMELEAQLSDTDQWEMVLANGEHEAYSSKSSAERVQDIVLKGHADGSIVAWGVSLPKASTECGKGNIWLPLLALRCGADPISCVAFDEAAGLLLAADVSGAVVIWEIFDEEDNIGSADVLQKVYASASKFAESVAARKYNHSSGTAHDSDEDDDDSDNRHTRQAAGAAAVEYITYSTYTFKSVREVLRARIPVMVTATLLIAPLLLVFVGGEDGSVYACSNNWRSDALFFAIDCLPRAADKRRGTAASGHVMGFHYSSFFDGERVVPVVYVNYSSGGVAVVDVLSLKMVAASAARDNRRDSAASESSSAAASSASAAALDEASCVAEDADVDPFVTDFCVMNSEFIAVHPPSLKAVCRMQAESVYAAPSRQPSGSIDSTQLSVSSNDTASTTGTAFVAATAAPAAVAAPVAEEAPKSRMRFFSSRSTASKSPVPAEKTAAAASQSRSPTPVTAATAGSSSGSGVEVHATDAPRIVSLVSTSAKKHLPRYLMYVKGTRLHYFDINKLTRASGRSSVSVGGFHTKAIAHHPIAASRFVTYRTKESVAGSSSGGSDGYASEDEDNSFLCASCVTTEGALIHVSLELKCPVSQVPLIAGVVDEEWSKQLVDFGTLLPNGNCYLVKRNSMMYTATYKTSGASGNLLLLAPLPDRCSPDSAPPNEALQLRHGREEINDSIKKAIKKRRSSVIKLTSAPTDLYKLFSKARATIAADSILHEHMRSSLLGGKSAAASKEGDDDEGSNSSSASANDSVSRAKSAMNQTAEALAERGQKIEELANKMEDFKQNASLYRQQVHEQKKEMERRNTRWGLF